MKKQVRSTAESEPYRLAVRRTEAAKLLDVSPRTVWAWTHSGKIPFVRLGKVVRYPVEELRLWLKEQARTRKTRGDKPVVKQEDDDE